MKYGGSTFDILYLLFAIVSGIVILIKAKNKTVRLMGLAALILGASSQSGLNGLKRHAR